MVLCNLIFKDAEKNVDNYYEDSSVGQYLQTKKLLIDPMETVGVHCKLKHVVLFMFAYDG